MTLIYHTGMHDQISHQSENKDNIFHMGKSFKDVVDVEKSFGIDWNKK